MKKLISVLFALFLPTMVAAQSTVPVSQEFQAVRFVPTIRPASPLHGYAYFDQSTNLFYIYDTNGWTAVGSGGGGCAGDCSVDNLLFPSPSTSTTGGIYKGTRTAAHRILHTYWDQNVNTADTNVFLGLRAGNFTMAYVDGNHNAASNTGIGTDALAACTSCGTNVALGANAAPALTTGFQNIFIGVNAGQFVTTGSSNTLIGKDADFVSGATAITGVTAIGIGACRDNTAAQCTAVGDHAAGQNTTGSVVVAIGPNAVGTNKTGGSLVGIGDGALGGGAAPNNGQSYSVAVGSGAMTLATTGAGQNVAMGFNSGFAFTTDDNMTLIGFQSDRSGVTPLTGSTAIGAGAKVDESNKAVIGTSAQTKFKFFGTTITSGTAFTVANVGANSCGTTAATVTGGNDNGGEFVVGATSGTQCRIAFTVAAPTRRYCTANDGTTTVAVRVTYVDSTHTDLIGTFTAADHLVFNCTTN